MKRKIAGIALVVMVFLLIASIGNAGDIYRLRMFFGLSLPGGGAVSLEEWQNFEKEHIAKTFEGLTIVDATGYYKGKPERSKIVTLILEKGDLQKAKNLAKLYAQKFKQEAVMMVKIPVLEWSFISAE